MEFRKIIEKFAETEDRQSMEVLADEISEFVERADEEEVKNLKWRLEMYLCPFKDKEHAEYAVKHLHNIDGTKGGHWDYKTTTEVAEKNNCHKHPQFHFVLNMIRSDYYASKYEDSDYIRMAVQFLKDPDAPEDKTERYYRAMRY